MGDRLSNDPRAIAGTLKSPDAERADLLKRSGRLLVSLMGVEQAIERLQAALKLTPEDHEAWFQLARAHEAMEDVPASQQALARARQLAPEKGTYALREMMSCPYVFEDRAQLEEYYDRLERQLDRLLIHVDTVKYEDLLATSFMPPYALAFHGRMNRTVKEKFARVVRRALGVDAEQPLTPSPSPLRGEGRIRIGFVVTFGHEPIFLRCMAEIVRRLDRERFEVGLVCHHQSAKMLSEALATDTGSTGRKPIPRSTGRMPMPLEVVPIDTNFRKAVKRIAEAEFHLLYYWEIGSDALNYYLPLLRLAPVQCTSWGTQATTGMHEVDYYLSSDLVEPPGAEECYTEKLWRMKSLMSCRERVKEPPPGPPRLGGPTQGKHLYLCPQTLLKFHPDTDELFGRILREDGEGVLIVKEGQHPSPGRLLRERIARTLADVQERIVFIPWQSREDYYRLLAAADVILDPMHTSAGSTTYDIFSLNQPIVALPGELSFGRYTLACYRRMEFMDLVANSLDEYVSLAVRLGCDRQWREHVRRELAERTSVLFDDLQAVSEYERFFESAVRGC